MLNFSEKAEDHVLEVGCVAIDLEEKKVRFLVTV